MWLRCEKLMETCEQSSLIKRTVCPSFHSRVVSPKLEPSTDPHLPPLPSTQHPPGLPVHPPSLVSPLHHTNPFCHSQTASPLMSPANPFFCLLQHNPFYDDMPLKPSPPPLPYLSSSRPPIAQLFPQASNANPGHNHPTTEEPIYVSGANRDTNVKRRPLPPVPTSRKSSNPFVSLGELESEWDESFEAFAAGRLQSPDDPTVDRKTQQNTPSDRPLEHYSSEGIDADQNTNRAPNHRPHRQVLSEARKAPGQLTNTNTHHLDLFAHFLETIPEHRGFETDVVTSNTSADAFTDTNQAGSTTNTKDFTNPHQAHCRTTSTQLSSSSPDPVSSGVGSSVEEDFLSCLSASSSEEAEAHNFESDILGFGKSPENMKPSEAEDCSTGGTNDRSFPDVAQQTVIHQQHRDGGVDSSDSQEALRAQSPTRGAEIENADSQTLNVSNIVYPDLLPNMSEIQPKPDSSSQSDDESREKGKNEYNSSVEESRGSSLSTLPSLHIITSSPDVKRDSSDLTFGSTTLGGQYASWCSPEPFGGFGDFINSGSGPEFDKTLLHTPASDQTASSFLQSLYVSADSQDYHTCESRLPSKSSELNSTLCGDLSEIHSTPDVTPGRENSSKPANGEVNESDRSDERLCGVDDKATTVLTMGGDSGLRGPPAAPDSSSSSCHPRRLSEEGVESPEVVLDDESSIWPQATLPTRHRSQSEGALTSIFDEVLLPSFGSDPGAVQESSLTQPGPDLPHLTSFDPPLTPDSRSSPVALSSSPPLAGASARSPPSTAPMPEETQQQQQQQQHQQQQQQAANQQNSPHPVKPLTTAILAEEKRTEGRSVLATGLEKLKSTIHPGRSSQLSEQETDRKKCLTEGAGSYYHLNHSELVALLVQREAEMERQRAEFERQRVLLAKREVELRKLKPQVRDLEDYIDTLLVRIMEQKPTLLQVRSKYK